MAVQTSYAINHNKAYAGLAVTFEPNALFSKLNKGTTTIPYGKGVVSDGENAARLPIITDTDALAFNGVLFRELNRVVAGGENGGAVPDRDATVLSHGVIWVYARATVVKDNPVYLITDDTSDPDYAGDFDNVASAGDRTALLIPGAKFMTGGATGDLVQISLGIGG